MQEDVRLYFLTVYLKAEDHQSYQIRHRVH
jgi:hypothetical protein